MVCCKLKPDALVPTTFLGDFLYYDFMQACLQGLTVTGTM